MQMDDIQSWWEVPSIAHFCSLFRAAFCLLDFDIEVCELEEALLTDGTEDSGSTLLQELIVKLLCGCYRSQDISTFNYQMFLRRLFRQKCQEYERDNPFNTDMDFQFLPLRTKVEILHALCDFRLDAEDVQDLLKNLESDSLRVEPLGHDENRSAYWYFYGTRLYREDYPRNRRRTKEKRKRGKEERRRKKHFRSVLDLGYREDGSHGVWQVVCFTKDDWDRMAEKFKHSRCKAEKALYQTISEDFLPEIPRLFAEKERKRNMEFLPRRQSSRLEKLKQRKEVESLQKSIEKKEKEHREQEQEKKDKLRRSRSVKASRAHRARIRSKSGTHSECGSVGSSFVDSFTESQAGQSTIFVGRQTNNSLSSATGQIVIQGLRRKLRSSQVFRQTEEDLQTGMYKILEFIKNHEDAWPFLEPVDEEYAPRYYSIINRPMDLQRMEDKLDEGEYMTFSDFKTDFQLIVDNCRKYNGTDNEYTDMVGNLQEAFQSAVDRYLESETSSDEEIGVEFFDSAPVKKPPPTNRPRPRKKKVVKVKKESVRIPTLPPSIPSPPSIDEDEKLSEVEEEAEEKSVPAIEAPDSDESSTKDEAETKSHSGTKRKKKAGPKNAPDIEALELATEQTLKDINKWLDDTPRYSEFSSASNSPSHFISTEEYEAGTRVENEYRRNLKMEKPSRSKDPKDNSKRRSSKDSTKQMRRREVQRTIERLQPGKSKGNLISNIQNAGKISEEGPPGKPKDTRSSLFPVVDETTPKLSLGTVLGTDVLGFGVGQSKHSFDQEENEEEKTVLATAEEPPKPIIDVRPKTPEPPIEMENTEECPEKKDKEEIEMKQISKDCRQEKAMPNLSAWFKAFGAPKSSSTSKKRSESLQDVSSIDIMNPEERSEVSNIFTVEQDRNISVETHSVIVHDVSRQPVVVETRLEESEARCLIQQRSNVDDVVTPVPLTSSQQMTPRHRKVSTGSTVSERSSFSQDLMDTADGSSPRLNLDDRVATYSEPYPSPLHQSPVAASPAISSPRPEEEPKFASYPPLSGTIRVGFYQDTSFALQKNSPEKNSISSHSPKEPLRSPFPTYSPGMYPPHDPGDFIAYQQSGPSSASESVYENSSYAGPFMTFYDTSKPLTDQYRAARTQESDGYSLSSPPAVEVSTPMSTSNSSSPPPPVDVTATATTVTTAFTPTPAHKSSVSVIPVKKRLYSEMELGSSSQSANRYQALPLSPPPAHSQSASRALPPESLIIIENAHHRSICSPHEICEKFMSPTSDNMYSARKSAINEFIPKRSERAIQHVSKKHQSIRTFQNNSNAIELADREPQSPTETPMQYTNKGNLSALSSPPPIKGTVAQASETFVPRTNSGQQGNSDNLPSDDDDDDCKVIKIQPSSVPVITSSHILNLQTRQKFSQNLHEQLGIEKHQQISTANSGQTVIESCTEGIRPGRLHASSIISTSPDSIPERLKSNLNTSLHGSDMSYHRGPFSPVPPSPMGMEHLALHGNLSNLTHVVDRFPASDRLLSGLPSPASPFFGEKGLNPQYIFRQNISSTLPNRVSSPTSSSPVALLSQASPSVMTIAYNHESQISPSSVPFNRLVPELPSVLPNKVSTIQASYNQSVQDLSTVLPSKSASPINAMTSFNRPVSEFTAIHSNKTSLALNAQSAYRSVNELSTVLSTKMTTPVDLKSYSQSVTDLSTTLPNKVSIPPSIGVISSYSRPAPDYSLLTGKTSDAQPTPKPSRKRKSKQIAASSSDMPVVPMMPVVPVMPVVTTVPSSTAFQQYVGLNTSPNATESSAIALKTATVLTGSAFNFGPAHTGLGIYSTEKDGYPAYLEDYRAASSSYYIPTPDPTLDKINPPSHPSAPAPTLPFPFSSHSRSPSYALAQAFINHQSGLVDPSPTSPLYQQYLHRHPEELLRHSGTSMVLHQGLLAPTASYTASYHPTLGIRQPYETLNRPTWL